MRIAIGFFSRQHAPRAVAFSIFWLIAAIGQVHPAAAQLILGSGANVQVTDADLRAAVVGAVLSSYVRRRRGNRPWRRTDLFMGNLFCMK